MTCQKICRKIIFDLRFAFIQNCLDQLLDIVLRYAFFQRIIRYDLAARITAVIIGSRDFVVAVILADHCQYFIHPEITDPGTVEYGHRNHFIVI